MWPWTASIAGLASPSVRAAFEGAASKPILPATSGNDLRAACSTANSARAFSARRSRCFRVDPESEARQAIDAVHGHTIWRGVYESAAALRLAPFIAALETALHTDDRIGMAGASAAIIVVTANMRKELGPCFGLIEGLPAIGPAAGFGSDVAERVYACRRTHVGRVIWSFDCAERARPAPADYRGSVSGSLPGGSTVFRRKYGAGRVLHG